jgi:sugar/nucleoside kinase (ribokinase family)
MMTSQTSQVVCAGILVADIFVPPLPRLPQAGELQATDDFLIDSGGCAANTATSLVKLGVPTTVIGKVGADNFGDFIENDLRGKGVNTAGIVRSTAFGTSKTVILPVIGEDRRYIHTFGANADFSGTDLNRELIAGAKFFYLGGYLVLPGLQPQDLSETLQFARQQGAQTMLDVVVPADSGDSRFKTLEMALPYVDIFTPNDGEAHTLTGETDPERQAKRLLDAGCGTVVITMGEHGSLLMNKSEMLHLPSFPVKVVDGSGAGDAFAAGFIVGLLEGWSMIETLRFASAVGGSACTRLGCTPGVFTRPEALAYLQAH